MTDEEIRRAFSGTPLGAVLLLVVGYSFMLTHADGAGIAQFTCGIGLVSLGVLLSVHAMDFKRWFTALPSMLAGCAASLTGAFVIILSMAPYLS